MPLAQRPQLPPRAARKLAEFVADQVLAMLHRREDLDADTAGLIDRAVRARIEVQPDSDGAPDPGASDEEGQYGGTFRGAHISIDRGHTAEYVQKLYTKGELNEATLDEQLSSGNRVFVVHALALMAGMPPSLVTRIVDARSAKAITSLAWKAGLRMRFAIKLQARLANVPTREILQAKDGVDYPLSEEDMTWQLDFYAG
jgi:hypothetical protein